MTNNETAREARITLFIMRGLAIAALIGIPFAFWSGAAPVGYLATGLLIGFLWFAALVIGWRRRNQCYATLAMLVLFFGHRACMALLTAETSPYFYQWLIVVVLAGTALPLLGRAQVLRFCRLPSGC